MVITKNLLVKVASLPFLYQRQVLEQGTVVKYEDLTTYNGVSFAKRIDEAFFPIPAFEQNIHNIFKITKSVI